MLKNNPQLFILSFQHTPFLLHLLCFAESTMKIVFSAEHSFWKRQLVTSTFSPIPKNHFSKKNQFGFDQLLLKPQFYSVFWVGLKYWKFVLAKTDSVHEKVLFPFQSKYK